MKILKVKLKFWPPKAPMAMYVKLAIIHIKVKNYDNVFNPTHTNLGQDGNTHHINGKLHRQPKLYLLVS